MPALHAQTLCTRRRRSRDPEGSARATGVRARLLRLLRRAASTPPGCRGSGRSSSGSSSTALQDSRPGGVPAAGPRPRESTYAAPHRAHDAPMGGRFGIRAGNEDRAGPVCAGRPCRVRHSRCNAVLLCPCLRSHQHSRGSAGLPAGGVPHGGLGRHGRQVAFGRV